MVTDAEWSAFSGGPLQFQMLEALLIHVSVSVALSGRSCIGGMPFIAGTGTFSARPVEDAAKGCSIGLIPAGKKELFGLHG